MLIGTVSSPQGANAALDVLEAIQRTRPLSREERLVAELVHTIIQVRHLADYQPEEDTP